MAKGVCCHVDTCVYNHDCNCEAKEITVCNCKCHEAKDIQETACETFKKDIYMFYFLYTYKNVI